MQMQLWQDGVVAVLAAVGVVELLWKLAQALMTKNRPAPKRALAVISAAGDGSSIQEQVRALTAIGRESGVIGRILVADCGLDEEGQKLCRILERENRWVILCRAEDVVHYLKDST